MDCIFCKIIKGELPCNKVYEDDQVLAFLDIRPTNFGHTLVIPKNHYDSLIETPIHEACAMMAVIQKITPAVLESVNAPAFNLHVNTGSVAGQVVSHTHYHIIPRFADDGYQLWHGKEISQEELLNIAEKITSLLS